MPENTREHSLVIASRIKTDLFLTIELARHGLKCFQREKAQIFQATTGILTSKSTDLTISCGFKCNRNRQYHSLTSLHDLRVLRVSVISAFSPITEEDAEDKRAPAS